MRRRSNSPPVIEKRRPGIRPDRRSTLFRRRRSFSRERLDSSRPRRSSPSFKRSRREDDHYDRYDRGSPHRRGYDRDRLDDKDIRDGYERGGGHYEKRDEPESYRDFIMNLTKNVTPDEAHRRYQDYLTNWYGSQTKSEFEQYKNEEWMRVRNDPKAIVQIIEKHKKYAQEAAKKFAEDLENVKELDIHSDEFSQGVMPSSNQSETKEGDKNVEKEFFAPQVCWSKDRVRTDLDLSKELTQKLDTEKEINVNPVLDLISASTNLVKTEEEDSGIKEECKEDPGDTNKNDDKDGEEAKDTSMVEEEEEDEESKLRVRKLDLLLTYLWRVHMVDYYSGHELNDKEYENTNCRMLRPPKNQQNDEETDKKMLEELAIRVDAFWKDRVTHGDPLELKAQRAKVEQLIEEYVESQVTQIDDRRWGNKLSSKMFVGKEYVVKHLRLKHGNVIEKEKEKILESIYFENFKKEKEENERKNAEHNRNARFDAQGMDVLHSSYNGEGGFGSSGQGLIGGPIVPTPMIGGPPLGQILMPAPGAGPLGPFVLQSVPTGGSMPTMEMGPMSGGNSGGNATGGGSTTARSFDATSGRNMMSMSGFGGNTAGTPGGGNGVGSGSGNIGGGGRRWNSPKEYYDLDAPQHNRAFLDYGEL